MSSDDSRHDSKDHRGISGIYRKAILLALESLHDFQTRSNIDAVRRQTQAILAEDEYAWNDMLFLKTMKSIVNKGEVNLCANISAELSPDYKRRRADSLLLKLEEERQLFLNSQQGPQLPQLQYIQRDQSLNCLLQPHLEPHMDVHSEHNVNHHDQKESAHRRSEHEKWKIMPKKIFDKTIVVNPMDTK